ncbi:MULTISPECIES: peptidoglycan editing factor PgeF [unclassified Streptomyces]|uniref:peptidoglycan editing factor PgeF n=1 Tax=unclassified Streptomyces TaxID=2593676 RepID=UPI002E77497F|nr:MULTISPECIES: peptidoglycan editing factor PgeF [unclassified Streptomyces]MEE1765432.1 peptidoglycan editing factor PgeF [Streptomyces sp. SP18BB07]MEE1834261.1 peptidoglycan editing factor PgeF [Streptomyces sp. SP17KL33]
MIGQRENVSGAHFAFTDRWGGVSAAPYEELNLGGAVGDDAAAVTTNRELAAKSLGLEPDRVVWMNQVHGADVAVVDGPWGSPSAADSGPGSDPDSCSVSGGIPAVDAIVTTRRGLALAVLTADCVPVLLADPVAGVVAAAHAGRPGMIAGVVPAAVRAMTGLGADPARIVARTGPAVCGRCYEVPEAMRAEVATVEPAAYAETSWGTPSVDVCAGVHAQLERLGVRDREQSPVCTLESRDHFSYRRDRATGRLAGYVWLD